MRKHRRRIKRKPRRKAKGKKRKSFLSKHLDKPVTNKFTRFTTYIMIALELLWVLIEMVWFYNSMIGRM